MAEPAGVALASLAIELKFCSGVEAMMYLLSLDKVYRQFGDVLVMEDVSIKFFCPLVSVSAAGFLWPE
jgi:hypothetical protein